MSTTILNLFHHHPLCALLFYPYLLSLKIRISWYSYHAERFMSEGVGDDLGVSLGGFPGSSRVLVSLLGVYVYQILI